jgi:aryl-alcohol dehydrogenase-like predicted oxidoreductase
MEHVGIAGTELTASRIGLGAWAIGGSGWGGSDASESVRTIHAAVEMGITLIDTAPVYGRGLSEEIVGRALREYGGDPDAVLVATKVGLRWPQGGVVRDARPAGIRQEVEDSLRRLGRERIDLLQVHWPDPLVPVEETAAAMAALHASGKIRAVGVSNFSPEQMEAFRRAAPLHASQPPYNLFEREVEHDVLPYCARHGITTLTYGVLCRGLLSGRMRPDTSFSGDDLRAEDDPKFRQPAYAEYLAAVDRLDRFAQENYGRRVIHLAARWALDQPGVDVALWGARRPEQIEAVEGVFGWSLDADALETIDRIVSAMVKHPVGPEFLAPPTRGGA